MVKNQRGLDWLYKLQKLTGDSGDSLCHRLYDMQERESRGE